MMPLNGVLVRTTIQENASPITTATRVPPPQGQRVEQRLGDVRLASTTRKFAIERWLGLNPRPRIGVGQRAKQQREQRIDHQKAKNRQQQRDQEPAQKCRRIPAPASPRCAGPPCPFEAFFLAGKRRASFLLRPSLVDGAAGGKWQKVAHRR